jgi:predicted dehydrogenase
MKISVIGAGLIGVRRARVARAAGDEVVAIFDPDSTRAKRLADEVGACVSDTADAAIAISDIAVVATPNKYLEPAALRAMETGRHVLIEKPMGRNLEEAHRLFKTQATHPGVVFKVGFNHRYHPALIAAHAAFTAGRIGTATFLRATYGHGGRPGCEKEWRGNPDLAGGGELTDQGVHLLDLTCWLLNRPDWAFAQRRTFVWPLQNLEDNGFFTLGWNDGRLAQMHTSWTQWKNRFSYQIYGSAGALEIEGLGGSYGEESLTLTLRKPEGGAPDVQRQVFTGPDESWRLEWDDFRRAINHGGSPMGNASEGLEVMAALDALYRSSESFRPVTIDYPHPAKL